jgi:thiol-disulfide isomerase/thioredoxin
MKKFIAIIILALMLSCEDKDVQPTYALISGTVSNTEATKAFISGNDFKQELSIDPKTGTFADTLRLPKSGYYQFSCGEYATVYLENGYDLKMTVDAKEFDESMSYSGKGSDVNNYLASKFMDNETMQGSMQEFYALNEEEFSQKVEEIKSNHLSKLSSVATSDFVTQEKENLKYEAYNAYSMYERIHKNVTQNPEFKVSEGFLPEELSSITFNDSTLYATSTGYQEMARNHAMEQLFASVGNSLQSVSPKELQVLKAVEISELKNEIISNYGSMFISAGNPNMKDNYKFLSEVTSSEQIKESLKTTYEKGLKLRPGEPSPEFVNYENHKGGETSLTDLRGKYVYIDVWATWCGPCIREIPSLKKVESEYHDRNIVFVSTSIDRAKDHQTWVDMVNDKQLGGTQLMADNAWQSQFVTDYGINGIPRFILVDPEGKIVSADAPRPSDPKLIELFKELKI